MLFVILPRLKTCKTNPFFFTIINGSIDIGIGEKNYHAENANPWQVHLRDNGMRQSRFSWSRTSSYTYDTNSSPWRRVVSLFFHTYSHCESRRKCWLWYVALGIWKLQQRMLIREKEYKTRWAIWVRQHNIYRSNSTYVYLSYDIFCAGGVKVVFLRDHVLTYLMLSTTN